MLDPGAWREHLALEKRTATEIVTVLSLAALSGATFYNLGFFAPIEWSLVSLLTVQDLIIAATISLLPMSIAALLALFVSRVVGKFGSAPRHYVALALVAVVIAAIGMVLFLEGPLPSVTGFLVAVYLFLAGLAALGNVFFKHGLVPLLWLAFSLVYIPLATGAAESLTSLSDADSAVSEVQTDRAVIRGKILRVTSAYLLLYDGGAVTTLPLNKVRMVKRLYGVSPEADFLPLLRSRARLLVP